MHELSIAQNLVELVSGHLQQPDQQVASVTLRIGALSCVHPGALEFSFEMVAAGTPLEGARLNIIRVPVSVWCTRCDSLRELPGIQSFRCPECQTPCADIREGRELDLESIEVAEPVVAECHSQRPDDLANTQP